MKIFKHSVLMLTTWNIFFSIYLRFNWRKKKKCYLFSNIFLFLAQKSSLLQSWEKEQYRPEVSKLPGRISGGGLSTWRGGRRGSRGPNRVLEHTTLSTWRGGWSWPRGPNWVQYLVYNCYTVFEVYWDIDMKRFCYEEKKFIKHKKEKKSSNK